MLSNIFHRKLKLKNTFASSIPFSFIKKTERFCPSIFYKPSLEEISINSLTHISIINFHIHSLLDNIAPLSCISPCLLSIYTRATPCVLKFEHSSCQSCSLRVIRILMKGLFSFACATDILLAPKFPDIIYNLRHLPVYM